MGMAYHPARWKFVEQQVVFEVIVQPYNVGLSCGGRSERKTCLWRVVFEIRGDCQQLTWSSTMLYLHPPPVWCTKWLNNSCECVCTKMCRPIPKEFLQALAWHGLDAAFTCWGSIVHITQQWMTTSWQMGSDLVLPTRLKLQHHQAAQPTLGELEMKDLLLRIGPQLEKIVTTFMFEDLQTWLLFINLRYLFWGGCFQTQAAQKGWNQWIQWPILTMSKYKYEAVWSSMKQYEAVWSSMKQYEAVWSSMKQSYSQLNGFWMSYPQKKKWNSWYLTGKKKTRTIGRSINFLAELPGKWRSPSHHPLPPPCADDHQLLGVTATWWGEANGKPNLDVGSSGSRAGAPKYADP